MNSMATELQPDEDDAVALWAEIHRLRAAVQGPDGYATWQEAATAERVRRVRAEKALAKFDAQAAEQAGGGEVVAEVQDWPDDATRVGIVPLVDLGSLPIGTKLYTHPAPAPAIPAGWRIELVGEEIRVVSPADSGPGGTYVSRWQDALTARLLYCLCDSLLNTKNQATAPADTPAAPVQQVGEREAFEAWCAKAGWKAECIGDNQYSGATANRWWEAWQARAALSTRPEPSDAVAHTYASTQATNCASCGEHKHTPLRIDAMGGYVCLTCIDKKLGGILGEFGYAPDAEIDALRRDAERYRAVRDDDCYPYAICIWDEDDGWAQDARKPDVVDAAIDAALAARGEKR